MQFIIPTHKRALALLLAACLCLCSLTACAQSDADDADSTDRTVIDVSDAQSSDADDASSEDTTADGEVTLTRYSNVFYGYFDTVTTVIAYCESQAEFDTYMAEFEAMLEEYNTLYDIYNTYEGVNNIATLNASAADAPVEVDVQIIDLLVEAKEMYALSDGEINIAMGSVLSLWHDARTDATNDSANAYLPDDDALQAASAHTDLDDMILDLEHNTVYFADPELQLDVGSCGKGYACEMIAQRMEELGVTSMLMSLGGNLRGIGTKPDDVAWVAGIEDPWAMAVGETASIAALQLTDMALVVSGDYQRYYTVDGVQYHHLIDPDTLYPADDFNSVSVLTDDAGLADCLSTALFCMTLEEGQALVESLENTEAVWCLIDGESVVYSSGFTAYLN